MEGKGLAFLIWAAVGLILMGLGVAAFFAKKEVGFFSNVRPLPMKDVRAYNRAVGKLFLVYGFVAILLGIPILGGQNSPGIILTILGVMVETIIAMAVYTIVIQAKYERK